MEFMDLLKEWLDLRDERDAWCERNQQEYRHSFPSIGRMAELEDEINARMRGELPR